jgi:transcriptional regulator with XRE-family HTH domain
MKILLDEIMYSKNISVRQLSIMSGIPRSTISDIMNEKHSPTLDNMELLAKALKVHITDLFESEYK